MNANPMHSRMADWSVRKDEQRPMHLVVLHDSSLSLEEANRHVHGLLSKFDELDVHRDEFSFQEVTHPQLLSESVELAAACDLFVFATQDGSTLPIEIVSWLKLWLSRRPKKETAFVSLVGFPNHQELDAPINEYFRHLAERNQLTFFSGVFSIPSPSAELTISTFRRTFSYNPRPERWGLNE